MSENRVLLNVRRSLALFTCVAGLAPVTPSWAASRDAVEARLTRALTTAPARASVAVRVERLDGPAAAPSVVFDRDGDVSMLPASNLKVLTSAAALAELGTGFEFQTRLHLRPAAEQGVADVLVVGGGDPSFGDSALVAGVDGWSSRTVLDTWAAVLAGQGVRRVRVLHLDDTIFDDDYDHPNWPENQKHLWYEAQVGGLNFNLNCVDVHLTRRGDAMSVRLDPPTSYVTLGGRVRAGDKNAVVATRRLGTNAVVLGGETDARQQGPIRVTVDGPTGYFGRVFMEALADAGIEADGTVTGPVELDDAWALVAVHVTPLAVVLARTNEDSINLYAESLLKLLGRRATDAPGSWRSGGEAVVGYLSQIGGATEGVHLDDGSGMSRANRVTAAALVAALRDRYAAGGEAFDLFRDTLSDAGIDGTLRNRFRDRRHLHGRVWGKSGYINGVSTLSGYLHARDGSWYAFAVLMNDVPRGELWKARAAQEAIVAALDGGP